MLPACTAFGVTQIMERADFISGDNTNGWTIMEGSWTSPAYPTNVAAFTATGTNLSEGSTLAISYGQNRFTITRTGNAALSAFSAGYVLAKLPVPSGFAVTNLLEGAFSASWSPVEDAIGYRLSFYTNRIDGATDGTALLAEDFSFVTAKGSASKLDADEFNALTDTRQGWTIATCYHGIDLAGVVQVGSASAPGWISFSMPLACTGTGRTLQIEAWNYNQSAGPDMPIHHVTADGSVTSVVAVVTLEDEPSTINVPLPELHLGDRIYIHSTTNNDHKASKDGRVNLDAVRVLVGFDPGHVVHDRYATADVGGTSFSTNGMPALDGFVTLKARSADSADDSDETEPIELDLANPPPMPILRAVPITSCDDGVYEEDFESLTNITAATRWYNGVWPIPYWMGYNEKGEIKTNIRMGTLTTTATEFMVFDTRKHAAQFFEDGILPDGWSSGCVLGFRESKDHDGHHGIAFHNDTSAPRRNIGISCEWIQWNYNNPVPMTNTVEYLVTNELVGVAAPGDWISVPALAFTPAYTSNYNDGTFCQGIGNTVLGGVTIGVGDYMIIRFSDWRSSTIKGGAGLDRFRFTSERQPLASYMLIR